MSGDHETKTAKNLVAPDAGAPAPLEADDMPGLDFGAPPASPAPPARKTGSSRAKAATAESAPEATGTAPAAEAALPSATPPAEAPSAEPEPPAPTAPAQEEPAALPVPAASPPAPSVPAPYRVLARKYRPQTFADLIGQEAMVRTLTNAFASGRIAQAYILTGVRGVGKTTTARILARALNYEPMEGPPGGPSLDLSVMGRHCRDIIESRHVDVMEMDAASNTSINDIREIIESARYRPVMARYKVYIIDEVHMLSTAAFNGLLKTLEEPPEHVKFIFATTEIRKVPVTVLSRCQRFDLRRVDAGVLAAHLAGICAKESVAIEPEALSIVARAAEGSVRDALSLLDQAIAHGGGQVGAEEVRRLLGLADRARVIDLFEALMKGETARALAEFRDQYDAGADPAVILTDLADFSHLVTRLKIVPEAAEDAALVEAERTRGATLAQGLSMRVLSRAWQMLLKGIAEVQQATKPAQAAEMVLVRLAYAADLPTPDEALRRLAEEGGESGSSGRSVPGGGGGNTARASGTDGREVMAAAAAPDPGARIQGVAHPSAPMAAALETTAPSPQMPPAGRETPAARAQTPVSSAAPGPAGAAHLSLTTADARPAPASASRPAVGAALAPDTPRLESLADVAALAGAKRDLLLKHAVETQARLVHFEDGRIEFALVPGADPNLVQDLSRKLSGWTGRRWLVSLSSRQGGPTLAEVEQARRAEREEGVKAHPLVAAVLARFPGAEVVDVRLKTAPADEPLAPAGDDAYMGTDESEPGTDDAF